ncbi:hypothetical protein SUGI_0049070 [Cryptomeria japonica]|uniref:uncharacterized protein LOC131069114 n=1 Tax=Cryptomeria japonica TaxID=3369 RepID=UPI002408AD89|nr:uncharacterized protein LOC131069114 [Cryptomeria japonica]GLJ06813.1 hypothetical protein SUGI_0049070 [Cryptomeria japonica]
MMKSRRILVVKEYASFTALASSNTTNSSGKAFLSDKHNQSDFGSSFPRYSLLDKSSNDSLTPENSYGDPYDFNANFNSSMAIVLIVLFGVFFFMGFFSVYVRRCASDEEDARGNSRRGGSGNGWRRSSQGLDKSIIETFPVFSYSLVKGLKQGKQALECAVCLSEFEDDETLRLLPKCSHAFHPDCIDMWLFSHTTCPLCRCSLLPGPNGVIQGLRFDVEAQLQQPRAPLLETDQVVVVIGARNAEQDNQGRVTNEMNSFDAGVCRTSPDQARVYNEHSTYATDSPILRITNSLRPLEKRSQNIRRSHSTGHSLVSLGGDPDRPSEFYISTDDRYVVDFAEELIQSSKNGLHRSCSYAALCCTGSPGLSYSQASVNDREKLWTYPSSVGEARPCSNPRASRGAEAESGQEFTRLSQTHFDPRISSDRWNISLHSPIFLRTFSERRAPDFQQREIASTSSTSHDSNPQDLKAFMQSFKKGFKWLRGRDKNMASFNGSETSRRSSRNAEGGGLLGYSFLM